MQYCCIQGWTCSLHWPLNPKNTTCLLLPKPGNMTTPLCALQARRGALCSLLPTPVLHPLRRSCIW